MEATGRQSRGEEGQEHPFQVKKVADEKHGVKSQVCAAAGEPRGPAALFGLADSASCGDAFKLNFKV